MRFIDNIRTLFKQNKKAYQEIPHYGREHLLQHISMDLIQFTEELEQRIEAAVSGEQSFPANKLKIILTDSSGRELQSAWSDEDFITDEQIRQTPGYQNLKQKVKTLGLQLELGKEDCEEYDDEDRYRFVVIVSGWET